MNPKPLDAGLAERLWRVGMQGAYGRDCPSLVFENMFSPARQRYEAMAAEVRKIVKEATKKGTRK